MTAARPPASNAPAVHGDGVAGDPDAGIAVATPVSADSTPSRDLGFGVRLAGDSRRRLLNRDGTFNVVRTGRGIWNTLSPYHTLLTLRWGPFLALLFAFYIAVNVIFAAAYVVCGTHSLVGPGFPGLPGAASTFLRAFFFSVETFATIGYGHVAPVGIAANIVLTVESMAGLLSVALVTGLVFARFSRPTAYIVYSRNALVAPFQGGTALMFRCVNARDNQLIEVSVRVTYSRIVRHGETRVREFTTLPLEYDHITFFPLSWTIVHPVGESSPLFGCSSDDLIANEAEFLILISATDDTFSQIVHSRTSYRADEVVWNARFQQMFVESEAAGVAGMDLRRIHDFDAVSSA